MVRLGSVSVQAYICHRGGHLGGKKGLPRGAGAQRRRGKGGAAKAQGKAEAGARASPEGVHGVPHPTVEVSMQAEQLKHPHDKKEGVVTPPSEPTDLESLDTESRRSDEAVRGSCPGPLLSHPHPRCGPPASVPCSRHLALSSALIDRLDVVVYGCACWRQDFGHVSSRVREARKYSEVPFDTIVAEAAACRSR
jgi:hypothetical protein|eukprot:COSAG01_NODE_2505_length_7553_cov_11.744030_4_plen_194_part_00